jgi:20S proteasome alpha/beta subunit
MKKEVQEAKGQLPEHYRKQPFKVQMRVEEAIKVYERAIRSILGSRKHEAQGLHSVGLRPAKHTKC